MARELNLAKREYEIKQEKITVTAKETSIKSETEKTEGETTGPNRSMKVMNFLKSTFMRNQVSFEDVQQIGYKLSIRFRYFGISQNSIKKVPATSPAVRRELERRQDRTDTHDRNPRQKAVRVEEATRECAGLAVPHRRQLQRADDEDRLEHDQRRPRGQVRPQEPAQQLRVDD